MQRILFYWKKLLVYFTIIIISLGILPTVTAQNPSLTYINPYIKSTTEDRLVFTYYFYWYDWNTGAHFYSNSCADECRYHPINITEVSTYDPNWHYREILDMMKAGIDVFMPVFWGGNPGNGKNDTWSKQGCYVIEQALDRLDAENVDNLNSLSNTNPIPKVAMFFDTTAMCLEYNQKNSNGTSTCLADLSNQTHCNTFYQMIKDFFIPFDEQHLQQVRPIDENTPSAYIVWLYGTDFFTKLDQVCIDVCRERFLDEMGHSLIFIGTDSWRWDCPQLEGYYYWGSCLNGMRNLEFSPIKIASVGCGFDNGNATCGAVCSGVQKPRFTPKSPELYSDNWTKAINTNPNWIVVETWNELHEGTSICRTIEYGDLYINITAQYSEKFHSISRITFNFRSFISNSWKFVPTILCIFLIFRIKKNPKKYGIPF